MTSPLYVTQPDLPPLEEFLPFLEEIWKTRILTNGGPFHQQFEAALASYLGVPHLSLCTNATVGLVIALRALEVKSEVITTPYSFVATAHSLLWNGLRPAFVDIDPITLNIDPHKIRDAITPNTSAILAMHCYGTPCDVVGIQSIAAEFGLKVIYDAAHTFGVKDAGGSVLRHGDLSVISFHATKVFNTFEGGAIICHDEKTKNYIDRLKNFGFTDEVAVDTLGINGKMSEINAALGLVQLNHIDEALLQRKRVDCMYREGLQDVFGLSCLPVPDAIVPNYSYFPILVGPGYPMSRDALHMKFMKHNVFTRRYFYPLISSFPMYKDLSTSDAKYLPVAESIAKSVLCLPIYPALSDFDIQRVLNIFHDK